jgi:hypothetical protein
MTAYLYVKANALYGTRISPSQHGVLVSEQARNDVEQTAACRYMHLRQAYTIGTRQAVRAITLQNCQTKGGAQRAHLLHVLAGNC